MSQHSLPAPAARPPKVFTGKHFLMWLLGWFSIVAIVNGIMFRVASATFSGVETESAYKLGLAYNKDLYAARQQDQRGWTVNVALTRGANGVIVTADIHDRALAAVDGLGGTVLLARPASKNEDRSGVVTALGDGHYRAEIGDLTSGQWDVIIDFEKSGERLFLSKNRVILN
jgi:nitrogen fixation protein FixH